MDNPARVRGIYSVLLFGASIVLTAIAIWLILIVWKGGWSVDRQEQQLNILGATLLLAFSGVLATVGFLAVGGPVRKIKAESKLGAIEINDDEK